MRILVAGATGAIGRVLVPMLTEAGHSVTGLSRALGVDIFDRAAVGDAVAAAAPEVIIHQLTALADRSLSDNARIRIEGTRNLVDAALSAGVRRMIAQSIAFAYAPSDAPVDESTPLDPTTEEPRATTVSGVRALESTVAELPEYVILRYGLFYGPGTWHESPDGPGSFVHVRDAAAAAVQALTWPNGVVNIVEDDQAVSNALARKLGWAPGFSAGA